MKIATKDLTGRALNWAVRKASGGSGSDYVEARDNFSTCWNKCGPIIEREGINLWSPNGFSGVKFFKADGTPLWYAVNGTTSLAKRASGMDASPLIAAMRCYVAIKLGDEVDIPEELL